MKRILCALFALMLLVGCQPAASSTAASPSNEAEPAAPSLEPLDREVPFLLSEHRDTAWADKENDYDRCLEVDEAGQAELYLNGYWLTATQKENNACLLSAALSENRYSDPVYTLALGEIRLWTDNAAVRVELLKDPYGIFAGLSDADLLVLYQSTYGEWTRYRPSYLYPDELPSEQMKTGWRCWIKIDDKEDLILLHSDENGLVRGTWQHGIVRTGSHSVDSETSCALLTSRNMIVIVMYDESGYGEPLLLGKRQSYSCAAMGILPAYCKLGTPEVWLGYGSKQTGALKFVKESAEGREAYDALEEGDYTTVMGVEQLVADYYLTGSGWVRVDDLSSARYDLLCCYQRDGETLAVVFDEDPTDLGLNYSAVGYACYAADGSLLAWGGLKPLDHVFADSYTYKKGESDFVRASGMYGYYYGEHCCLYFTDDARKIWLFEWGGDYGFEVEPILPASNGNA